MEKTKIKIYFVLVTLLVSILLGNLYINRVSLPNFDQRTALVNDVLKGKTKADYLYSMYTIALVYKFLTVNLFLNPHWIFPLIDFLGIIFLCLCAYWFLIRLFHNPYSWYSGLIWLFATSPLLFKRHWYHPSDFYGTGLMFLILISAKEQKYWRMAILCFISGFLWEKVLFVPLIFFLYQIRIFGKLNSLSSQRLLRPLRDIFLFISRREHRDTVENAYMLPLSAQMNINKIKRAIITTLPSIIATLLWYIFWRVSFPGAYREYKPWQEFLYRLEEGLSDWILWLMPIGIIIFDKFLNKRRLDSFWFYWLLYLPILIAIIVNFRGWIDELRSFWILQPIFIGLIGNWVGKILIQKSEKVTS